MSIALKCRVLMECLLDGSEGRPRETRQGRITVTKYWVGNVKSGDMWRVQLFITRDS
jgi:hypothetical protein